MAAYQCLNCGEIDRGEEDCCESPDLFCVNDMPAEIKRLRELVAESGSGRKCAQCKAPYKASRNSVGCPKCAPGVNVEEEEFRKPLKVETPTPRKKPTVVLDCGTDPDYLAYDVFSDWDSEKNELHLCLSVRRVVPVGFVAPVGPVPGVPGFTMACFPESQVPPGTLVSVDPIINKWNGAKT